MISQNRKINRRLKLIKRNLKNSVKEKSKNVYLAFPKSMRKKILREKLSIKLGFSMIYLILIGYMIISAMPFIWAFVSSFRPQTEFDAGGAGFFPEHWVLDGYKYIWNPENGSSMQKWLVNSFIICFFGTIINLVCNTLAGYSLSRLNYPGRTKIFWIMLATTMVPAQVLLIPNYLIMTKFHLIGTYTSVIISAGVNVTYIFMTRQFFTNFPKDVEEAAEIDGISKLGKLWKISIPLLLPIIATQTIFTFTGYWNTFLTTNLYLGGDADKWPITVGLFSIVNGQMMPIYNRILSASIISIIPVLILYIVLNNFFMKSYRMDGEK